MSHLPPPEAPEAPHTADIDGPINNVALVPASLLPCKAWWQALANALPPGSILVCLPTGDGRRKELWLDVISSIRAMGRRVLVIPSERILSG
jgi:hypothetical protein